jgi:hypothetical protein
MANLNSELERKQKEAVVDYFEVKSRCLTGGTKENKDYLSFDSWYQSRDSNWTPAEYSSEMLPLHVTCSV